MLSEALRLDRSVFAIGGTDAESFLQNLLTNDVERLRHQPAIYAGLLTPQGKVFADFVLWAEAGGFLVDVAASRAVALRQRLSMYRLRAKVEIGEIETERGVFASLKGDALKADLAALDPRRPDGALGGRAVATLAQPAPAEEPVDYLERRLRLSVPDLSRDAVADEVFALEALFEELRGVDFAKGCFVGQENVSRMKRRATTRKKFCPVTFDGPAPAFGTVVTAGPAELGSVRTGVDGRALALLRLDRATEAQAKGDVLMAGEKRLTLDPPSWLILPADAA